MHEAAYNFVMSMIGQHLDAHWLPRLHALGVAGSQGGVAIMLPSGGGKSTLALRVLETEGVKLLSEDTPLIDRHARLHPFPLRIGVNATDAARLPSGKVRRIERMEFQPKVVLELEAFADRIQRTPTPLRHLVIGRRTLGREASLEPLPRRAAVGTLVREMIVGVGVYQGDGVRVTARHEGCPHQHAADARALDLLRCCVAGSPSLAIHCRTRPRAQLGSVTAALLASLEAPCQYVAIARFSVHAG